MATSLNPICISSVCIPQTVTVEIIHVFGIGLPIHSLKQCCQLNTFASRCRVKWSDSWGHGQNICSRNPEPSNCIRCTRLKYTPSSHSKQRQEHILSLRHEYVKLKAQALRTPKARADPSSRHKIIPRSRQTRLTGKSHLVFAIGGSAPCAILTGMKSFRDGPNAGS
jgi:hypothetical protein